MTSIGRSIADAHRNRLLFRGLRIDTTPPPPARFASFGPGAHITPPARVSSPECIHIGADVEIGEHAWLSVVAAVAGVAPRLTIADGSRLGAFAHIACVGRIDIGAHVVVGERVFIADTYHGYEDVARPVRDQPLAPPLGVTIGSGARLGDGSIVLLGVSIGEGAQVDAGAVVAADVPPGACVGGNPARPRV